MKCSLLFNIFFLLVCQGFAQTDPFSGTWKVESAKKNDSFKITLQLSNIQDYILYPASLKIECDSFSGSYSLLLIKKNSREIIIGRNKIPVDEKPFSIENLSLLFNGTLTFTKDKSSSFITLNRMYPKSYGTKIKDLKSFAESEKSSAQKLISILGEKELKFTKINDLSWVDKKAEEIINSPYSGNYFGKMDTIFTESRDLTLKLTGKNNGVVSASVNGNPIFEHVWGKEKKDADELWLEPGLNMVAFYAEEFGTKSNSTGKLFVRNGKIKSLMDLCGINT